MGLDTFVQTVKKALVVVGIDTGTRTITNQSLRVSAHNLHELMGLSESETASTGGHAATKPREFINMVIGTRWLLMVDPDRCGCMVFL